jgi:WD40 repeat protein
MKTFKGHTNTVWSVIFSQDGQRITSGSIDRTVRVWDSRTGDNLVGPLNGHTDIVSAVAFSDDGKQTRKWAGSFWDL